MPSYSISQACQCWRDARSLVTFCSNCRRCRSRSAKLSLTVPVMTLLKFHTDGDLPRSCHGRLIYYERNGFRTDRGDIFQPYEYQRLWSRFIMPTTMSKVSTYKEPQKVALNPGEENGELQNRLQALVLDQNSSTDIPDVCPVCKQTRYLKKDLRFLVNPECYHKMCESCVDRIFSQGPAPCPVAGCAKTLRKQRFRSPTFADLRVEREVDIRRRVATM
jgi:hypothetical protein